MTTVTVPGFEGALGQENKYSDNFFAWAHDFNKDGWNDILIVGFPGTLTSWFENPKGAETHWRRHDVFRTTDNESPTFADLTGDGKPELVCITGGRYGYAAPDWADPAKPWTFHPLSPDNKYGKFTHGMGLGDVNGDRRLDLLEKNGWWEQPASLAGDPVWRFHEQPFGAGGSQMHAYDVNGDGLSDIITALEAHGFGLAWYEQYREGTNIRFRQHVIMNKEPQENRHGVKFSELHAIDLVDIDGDGLKDIVTGKRFWSHGRTGDPDRNSPGVLYWFKLARTATAASTSSPIRSTTIQASAPRWWPRTSMAMGCPTSSSATRKARSSTCTRGGDQRASPTFFNTSGNPAPGGGGGAGLPCIIVMVVWTFIVPSPGSSASRHGELTAPC